MKRLQLTKKVKPWLAVGLVNLIGILTDDVAQSIIETLNSTTQNFEISLN